MAARYCAVTLTMRILYRAEAGSSPAQGEDQCRIRSAGTRMSEIASVAALVGG
jgi:hypothetical protein